MDFTGEVIQGRKRPIYLKPGTQWHVDQGDKGPTIDLLAFKLCDILGRQNLELLQRLLADSLIAILF